MTLESGERPLAHSHSRETTEMRELATTNSTANGGHTAGAKASTPSQPLPLPPVSAFTPSTPNPYSQPQPKASSHSQPGPSKLPQRLLSTHLLQRPEDTVGNAITTVFPKPNAILRLARRFKVKHSVIEGLTKSETARWEAEGTVLRQRAGWKLPGEQGVGVEVTELFWKMYLSLLPTLERDPLSGLVPPDLLGSTTTMPLSIISLIPDIMQHYRDVIIRAEKEVFLATNYWQPSNSVNTISQSLKDLSARIVKEKKPKVVVKIMYDRGSWEQLWNAHAPVKSSDWTPLDLPADEDIPGLDMEVVNFHRVLLGTFHAKFLVVDRKVALLNSNNIQDRPNLELMSHFEGPIVDSFYEVALHSWYNRLSPPLPCMSTPYVPPKDSLGRTQYLFQDHNPYFDDIEILKAARAARILLRRQTKDIDAEKALYESRGRDRFHDAVQKVVDRQRQTLAEWSEWKPGEELNARAQSAMHELREFRERLALNMGGMVGSRAGSRSNSRGPSRRASATDVGIKSPTDVDRETAHITAQNAAPVDPSEAPSTPTVTGDTPLKAKTYPQPGLHLDEPPTSAISAVSDEGQHDKKKPHVLFLDTKAIDGSGRLFDNHGDVVDSPLPSSTRSPAPRLLGDVPVTASPMTSALQLPPDSPKNEHGEPLPLSAQMPDEIERSLSQQREAEEKRDQVPVDIPTPDAENSFTPKIERRSSEAPPEGTGSKRMFHLSKKFNDAGAMSEAWANVEDSDELDNFRPHVVHAPHDPFPIAMCCRKPHGFPGHHDIRNPQNAAFLAGFRYAKRKVFIQTPTLNARPVVRAIKQTCRRGVEVTLFLDLGFNDRGESIPFQGGTNEEVVDRLYKILRKDKKEQFLKIHWYTGKDQRRPLNAVTRQRNCHVKFAMFDDEVVILGNGNQDTQSWFHSQEVNVMIDSKQITSELMKTLIGNQNTKEYGGVGSDGVWRDEHGKSLADYGLTQTGAFRGLKAFIAFAKSI